MAWLLDIEKCLEDTVTACSAVYTSVNGCEELTDRNSAISDAMYRLKKLRNTVEAKGDSLMVSCDEIARYVCESGVVASLKRLPSESKRENLHLFVTTLEETYLKLFVSRIREFLHSVREFQDVLNEAKTHHKSSLRVHVPYLASGTVIVFGFVLLVTGLFLLNVIVLFFGTAMTVGGSAFVIKRKYDAAALGEQSIHTRRVSVEGIVKVERQLTSCIDQLRQQRVWLVGAKEADTDSLMTEVENFLQSMKSILGIHRTWKADRFKRSYEQY